MGRYDFYNDYGCGAFPAFKRAHPDFDTPEFEEYAAAHNRGDRDSGELGDVAAHEVLRLAADWAELRWRFPNVNPDALGL